MDLERTMRPTGHQTREVVFPLILSVLLVEQAREMKKVLLLLRR